MSEPTRAIELYELVIAMMKAESWLDAIKLLENESSAVDTNWKLSWNLGWCYYKLERFEEAQRPLVQARKLNPGNAICEWALGTVCLEREQFKEAAVHLVESLRIKDSHTARIALALVYLSQGKVAEAESIHREGIKLKPEDGQRYESYACFLEDVGREVEANEMYCKAKQLQGAL